MQSIRQYEIRDFVGLRSSIGGGHVLLRVRSIIQSTLKSICLSRTPQSSVLSTQHLKTIALLLIPCTLYLIPALLPPASAAVATLGWEPNPEPDLEGYVVYRNTEKSGPPYTYSDEVTEGELDDPLNPRLKLTGLKKDTKYYVALTAYNTAGIESGYSNEVCIKVIENAIQACSEAVSPSTSSSSKSAGGGGGGACFISSVSDKPSTFTQFEAKSVIRSQMPAMLFLLLAMITAIKLRCNKANLP